MLIRDTDFVIFDLETTGLNPESGHRICEIGAVKVRNSAIVSSFQSLINPQRTMPEEVIGIHGITDSDVSQSPSFSQTIESFLDFIGGCPLLAYNLKFDLSFLDYQLKLVNRPGISNEGIDILFMCRMLIKNLPKYNLSEVARFLNFPVSVRHRAYQDSELAALVFYKLVSYLEGTSICRFSELYSVFGYNKDRNNIIYLQKIEQIRHALSLKANLIIKYYSLSQNKVIKCKVLPCSIEESRFNFVLTAKYVNNNSGRVNFNLDRILDLTIV